MNAFTRFVFVATTTLLAAASPAADSAMKSADMPMGDMPMAPNLMVGDAAPAFDLKDANGDAVSLRALVTRGTVALVFYRSADWCPYCAAQLKELQANLPALEKAGITVVGISYDSVDVLARAAKKHGVTFTLLSDEGSKTIDAYGIRNQEATGKAVGVPHPTVFVLDDKGMIRARLGHEGYKTRVTSAEILAAAKKTDSMM